MDNSSIWPDRWFLGPKTEDFSIDMHEDLKNTILNRSPITWEWLAGFHQAEGGFYVNRNVSGNYFRWSVSQSDPEIIGRIRNFLGFGTPYENKRGSITLWVYNKDSVKRIYQETYPYLIGNKRSQALKAAEEFNISVIDSTPNLTWKFVTGFWEGDGNLDHNGMSGSNYIVFSQSDLEILIRLKEFFKAGQKIQEANKDYGFKTDKKGYYIKITDPMKENGKFRRKLLEHSQTLEKRTRLVVSLIPAEAVQKGVSPLTN